MHCNVSNGGRAGNLILFASDGWEGRTGPLVVCYDKPLAEAMARDGFAVVAVTADKAGAEAAGDLLRDEPPRPHWRDRHVVCLAPAVAPYEFIEDPDADDADEEQRYYREADLHDERTAAREAAVAARREFGTYVAPLVGYLTSYTDAPTLDEYTADALAASLPTWPADSGLVFQSDGWLNRTSPLHVTHDKPLAEAMARDGFAIIAISADKAGVRALADLILANLPRERCSALLRHIIWLVPQITVSDAYREAGCDQYAHDAQSHAMSAASAMVDEFLTWTDPRIRELYDVREAPTWGVEAYSAVAVTAALAALEESLRETPWEKWLREEQAILATVEELNNFTDEEMDAYVARLKKLGPMPSRIPEAGGTLEEEKKVPSTAENVASPAEQADRRTPATNPHKLANRYRKRDDPDEQNLLRYHRDHFWRYDGAAYRPVPLGDLRPRVNEFIGCELRQDFLERYRRWQEVKEADGEKKAGRPPEERPATRSLTDDVLLAMQGLCLLPAEVESPSWLHGSDGKPNPLGILPMKNGLLDLAAAADGKPDCLLPPSPSFFTTNAAEFGYDPNVPEPKQWLSFLSQLWPNDPESVNTLQEWFGLMLTLDTRHQKILFLLGPPRCGKGTIARVLTALAGKKNVCAPTLSGLSLDFGLQPLLGKSVAIIADARLGGRTDIVTVTERLLSISGEDTQTVNSKFRDQIDVRLSTRFTIISNELPKLTDASGALPSRLILLHLTRSFLGKEDSGLSERLIANELPGVLKWAIAGWKRLRDRGHFVQPETGNAQMDDMRDLASPVSQFVREKCVLGTGDSFRVPTASLYAEWARWCGSKGKQPGVEQHFGRDLLSAFTEIKKPRPTENGKRVYYYVGVRLLDNSNVGSSDPGRARSGTPPAPNPSPRPPFPKPKAR